MRNLVTIHILYSLGNLHIAEDFLSHIYVPLGAGHIFVVTHNLTVASSLLITKNVKAQCYRVDKISRSEERRVGKECRP